MEQTESGKKLILAIIQEADYDMVVSALTEHSFYVTQLSSTGGFLKKRNVTIMIGVENERLALVLDILKENDVKATFFVTGYNKRIRSQLIAEMDRRGFVHYD